MMDRVAVCNQKGGVGKTTVSINLAGALNAVGNDVLFVDLDPQGHATEGLGLETAYRAESPNLFTVLVEDGEHIHDIVEHHQEMDVIPSNIDLTQVENALLRERGREFKLRQAIDRIAGQYDHVIFDCPPNLGTITDNAMLAAQNILIPVQAEKTSTRAVNMLLESQIDPIEDVFTDELDTGEITIAGVVANRVNTTDNESEEMMGWLTDSFPVPIWSVFQRVALQRAWENSVSIFQHGEDCDMQTVFEDIAREIEAGESYSPDPETPFKRGAGAIGEYVTACNDGMIETDGGYRANEQQQTLEHTFNTDNA